MSDLGEQLRSYGDQLESMVHTFEFVPEGPKEPPTRWRAVAGIAASLLVIVGAFVLSLQRPDENTQSVEVISQPSTTTAETQDPLDDEWERLALWTGQFPGRVRTEYFEPSFSFLAPVEAGPLCPETTHVVDVVPQSQSGVPSQTAKLQMARYQDVSMRDVFHRLMESGAVVTETVPTTVGGAPAVRVDATAPGEGTTAAWIDATTNGCSIGWADGERWRFWIVDVDAELVVISLHAPADGFQQILGELEPVVSSLSWRDFDKSTASRFGPVVLPKGGSTMRPGQYFSTRLGPGLYMESSDRFEVRRNEPGYLVVADAASTGVSDRDIAFHRVAELIDPRNVDLSLRPMESRRIDDWLASPPQGLDVGPVQSIEVDGYPAKVFDVRFRPDAICIRADDSCWAFARNGSVAWMANLLDGILYRVYWVDQGSEDPIVILVAAPPGAEDWFDNAKALIDTVQFGPIEPDVGQRDS